MKFTVEKETWLRGEGWAESCLLRGDGKRCCLGFYGQALGLEDKELFEIPGPADVEDTEYMWGELVTDSDLANSIMNVNDDKDLTDIEREYELTELFEAADIEVEFI